jgi:outer membrane protein OmpA-like peptidoglycan-associated protein
VSGHLLFSGRGVLDYARQPLVLKNAAQDADVVVNDQLWLHALGSFSLVRVVRLSLDVPLVIVESGDAAPSSGATAPRPSGGFGLGDIRIGARVKILGSAPDAESRVDFALASSLWVPTATSDYGGDGAARVRVAAVLDGASQRLYWAFNGGIRTRPSEQLPGLLPSRVGSALGLGLAGGFFADAKRNIAIGVELVSDLTFGGDAKLLDPRSTVVHALATGHYRVADGPFEIGAAVGPGIGDGPGSAAWRSILTLGYAPEQAAPPSDEDDDGIPDKEDACVKLAGVPARDPLLNGCPEPPSDRDGDAIPDDFDACPLAAGEPTGVRATHGCPKTMDRDGDGVPDVTDACPLEAGARPPEGNGCPRPAPPKAELVEKQIVITQQVQFETGTAVLRPESDTVLGEVARVLAEHAEVELVEVQGHTDDTGTPDFNRRLGRERAESVIEWLKAHGIAAGRLVAKGYGSDRPLAENSTEEGRAKNRRVEFRVIRKRAETRGGAP